MLQSPAHSQPRKAAAPRHAFTLIEILVVIGIITILVTIAFPAIRALTKSNDHSQAANVVRAYLSAARNIAISQQRRAGVVFFEETPDVSSPSHDGQTAMQLFVEDYNQRRDGTLPVTSENQNYKPDYRLSNGSLPENNEMVVFVYFSTDRQYLPRGIKVATLDNMGTTGNLSTGLAGTVNPTRAVVFDARGNLIFQRGLSTPSIGKDAGPVDGQILPQNPGAYPWAYKNWNFIPANTPSGMLSDPNLTSGANATAAIENIVSSPGFFLYSKNDFDEAVNNRVITDEPTATRWLLNHSDVILVNAFTGNVQR